MEDELKTRTEKIKAHFKKHKKIYIGEAVGIAVAVAVGILLGSKINRINQGSNNNTTPIKADKVWFNMTNNYLNIGGRTGSIGRPGKPIRDKDTGNVYRSITSAAHITGLSPTSISQNIHGDRPDVRGHRFELLLIEAWKPEFNMDLWDPDGEYLNRDAVY
jgi:hypothetical protein